MVSTAGAFLLLVATTLGEYIKACELPRRDLLALKAFPCQSDVICRTVQYFIFWNTVLDERRQLIRS